MKKKVIEILFSWTQSLPSEAKIGEAYQMLKRQSIISEDPILSNRSSITPVPQRTKSIFDQDEEKSKVKRDEQDQTEKRRLVSRLGAAKVVEESSTGRFGTGQCIDQKSGQEGRRENRETIQSSQ